MQKAPSAFRTISEVAEELDVPQHVLRFWETRFSQMRPLKRGGGRRYYRPEDVDLIKGVKYLLYGQGYTIKGVQRIMKEGGVKFIQNVWKDGVVAPPRPEDADGPLAAAGDPAPGVEDAADLSAGPSSADAAGEGQGDAIAAPVAVSHVVPRRLPGAQGALLVRRPAPPALSVEEKRALQGALADLAEAQRILALAGKVAAEPAPRR
jgi:DNA-binding transcriptional MerR regulator